MCLMASQRCLPASISRWRYLCSVHCGFDVQYKLPGRLYNERWWESGRIFGSSCSSYYRVWNISHMHTEPMVGKTRRNVLYSLANTSNALCKTSLDQPFLQTRVIDTIKAPSQPPIVSSLRSRGRPRLHNACWLPKHNHWRTRSHSNLHWCCTDRRCSPTHPCPSHRQQCSQATRRPGSWRNRLHPSAWRGILGIYSRCKCRIGQLAPWD